jgi:hypothetical protein
MTRRWPLLIFRSLGQRSRSRWLDTVKWFPDDNSRKLTPRITKLHRYMDHDWQMTPFDFQVTRSKVKVTVTKNVFTQWLPLQLKAHMGDMHVLQTALFYIILNFSLNINSFLFHSLKFHSHEDNQAISSLMFFFHLQARLIALYFETKKYQEALVLSKCLVF